MVSRRGSLRLRMSGRPKRACQKCTAQKLRCSGERPSCTRCLRLRRPCVYDHVPRVDTIESRQRDTEPSIVLNSVSDIIPRAIPGGSYHGIPAGLVDPLIDIYFSHVYNASLLLHRPTFVQAVAKNTVRADVLLSVCAFAAKFHRDVNNRLLLLENGFVIEWASQASRLAFQLADAPQEENIVSLLNLSLVWYSLGEFQKSSMHGCCATNTAIVLGLNVEKKTNSTRQASEIEKETRRRRFWACWVLSAYHSQRLMPSMPSEQLMKLRLPCTEDEYQQGTISERFCMEDRQTNGSIYAELAKATKLWSAVHHFVKQSDMDWAKRLAAIQELDGSIATWWSDLDPNLKLSPGQMRADLTSLLLLVPTIYHACLCTLYSSIVPLFSWSTEESHGASPYARRLSAQTALEHANAISALFRGTQEAHFDPARFAGFFGFAAYSACAIQIPFLWCTKTEVRQAAHANLAVNLEVLKCMGQYWKFVELLGRNVRRLYEMHARHPVHLPNEPIYVDASLLDGHQVKAARARLSILTHNEITIGDDGAVAKQPEDVEELRLEGEEYETTNHTNGTLDDQLMSGLNPFFSNPFPGFDDFAAYDAGTSISLFDEMENMGQLGFDDWIAELSKGFS